MPFTVKDLTHGFVAPAVVAAIVLLVLRRVLSFERTRRVPAPLALTLGFVVGYVLLSLGALQPKASREWLPYIVLLATAAAAMPSRNLKLRCVLVLTVAALSAWLLVPHWDRLEVPDRVFVLTWHAALIPTIFWLEPLEKRLTGWTFPAALFSVAACASIVLLLSGSLRFCQIVGCGAGAMAGITLACALDRKALPLNGITFPFTILVAGILLVGLTGTFSEVPRICFVLPSLAPLALWAVAVGRLSRLKGTKRVAASIGLPLLVAGIAVIVAVVADYGTSGE